MEQRRQPVYHAPALARRLVLLDVGRELRGLIACAHPDRWPGNALAHEVTARLTELRSRCAA